MRLTAWYSGLFLATAASLTVAMNALLTENLHRQAAGIPGVPGLLNEPLTPALGPYPPPRSAALGPRLQLDRFSDQVLRYQWLASAVTVGALALLSIGAGWWLTGRALRPLHRITETARRLSMSSLHQRIALVGARDELSDLADTFDSMLGRLEAAVDNQRRFIANAAHELRTPLAIERTAIQVGLVEPDRERLARVREDLLAINRRNERLINGLLLLAQAERDLEIKEAVALDEVVREALAETVAPDGIRVICKLESAMVRGDRVLLQRLAANLLQNAVRHNRPGGQVEIQVTATATLAVSNTGPEIPEDRIDELFQPFRRLNPSRTGSAEGAGLGLSIVASIARVHGATIAACPRPGGGLDLTVAFPRAGSQEADHAAVPGR
ncbi:MAG TPA: ATP-binding protein [Polyangia bacterium]|nr:ATP-binding protein [Polyangia bacterium]